MSSFLILFSAFVLTFGVKAQDKIVLPACGYAEIFHKMNLNVSTTTLRKEYKVTVHESEAEQFISDIENILGDHNQPVEKFKRLKHRERPDHPDEVFATKTDYFPVFKGLSDAGSEIYKTYIRMRQYFVIPKGTRTADLKNTANRKTQPLVDQEGEYVKLEFKVGHPEQDHDLGESKDMVGVVDKPGIVILRKDADLLFSSKEAFEKNRAQIAKSAKQLTVTKKTGETKAANREADVDILIERIGKIHEALVPGSVLSPHHETVYQRQARTVVFEHPPEMIEQGMKGTFEVQITIDADIQVNEYATQDTHNFREYDRVVELKIPTAYANVPDSELIGMGLGELARIRAEYLDLTPQHGTLPGRGKTKNAPLRKPPRLEN